MLYLCHFSKSRSRKKIERPIIIKSFYAEASDKNVEDVPEGIGPSTQKELRGVRKENLIDSCEYRLVQAEIKERT
ncbi:MAG: hypothetical protein A2Z25_05780 [Planctomycetes bacterium RBG_16_55_9]|nr:MAG: hypothetical protein A2Z25_05780 [Planctomycetes bacterium RBG_16_55_9]